MEDIQDLCIYIYIYIYIKVDSKLKFHTHTDIVTKKAYHVLGLISKSFECKDPDVTIKLYTTLVCPIVEYNNILWGPIYLHTRQPKTRKDLGLRRFLPVNFFKIRSYKQRTKFWKNR